MTTTTTETTADSSVERGPSGEQPASQVNVARGAQPSESAGQQESAGDPPPRSQPPPLPESASRLSPGRIAADEARADRMLERLAASDYSGALSAAEALLLHHPLHGDALECAEIARSELRKLYVARLGSLKRVPRVAVGLHGLSASSLDFRAGMLVARIDNRTTLQEIVDECGLPPLDTLRILSELYLQQIIEMPEELSS